MPSIESEHLLAMNLLSNRRILLGVTGGIAAYKSAELLRRLQDNGAEVKVIMTSAATEFITPLTMQALSGHPVHLDLLDPEAEAGMGHIELARWADALVIAPASANFMSRLAEGRADDLLSTVCLATPAIIAIAPAMNQQMWHSEATQQNCDTLKKRGIHFFGPDEGLQACGDTGFGRMLEVDDLCKSVQQLFTSGSLNGKRVVITAGPTREMIDPVRYISNRSSGKMGYALAQAAIDAGAETCLISGPTNIKTPERATLITITSAEEMYKESLIQSENCDIFIAAAAVADYRPTNIASEKIKKDPNKTEWTITLEKNPDIVATIAEKRKNIFVVGFAAESNNLKQYAKDKLQQKKLDMIIANDISQKGIGFDSDQNAICVFLNNKKINSKTDHQEHNFKINSKHAIAKKLIELISQKIDSN